MPKAFFANMHPAFSTSLNIMLQRSGYDVYTPDEEFTKAIRGKYPNTTAMELPGGTQISQSEFRNSRMDILFLLCIEQELGNWWQEVAGYQEGASVIHYAGNDNVPYNREKIYSLIAADSSTVLRARPPRSLQFYPILPFDIIGLNEGDIHSRAVEAEPLCESYVACLKQFWPRGNHEFEMLWALLQKEYPEVGLRNNEGLGRDECFNRMRNSLCTVHFKDAEGYGYACLESMAHGVPVIAPKWLVSGRTLAKFIEHGRTGYLVDNAYEALDIIKTLHSTRETLGDIGRNSYHRVREIINEEEQVRNFKEFIDGD